MSRVKASKVEYGKEWWRKRYAFHNSEKHRLRTFLDAKLGSGGWFRGSTAWCVVIRGRNIYKKRPMGRMRTPEDFAECVLVGRIIGKYMCLNKKAPRWLKNWAKWDARCVMLPKLDRATLAAHLMKEKLQDGR